MTWYYWLGVIVWGLFILKTLMSWLIADLDTDFDLDADGDIDIGFGDIVSFKGLIHLLMGFTAWIDTKSLCGGTITYMDYFIGAALGIVFVIILFYLYKFLMKLNYQPSNKKEKDLVGTEGTVYLSMRKGKYVITVPTNNGTVQIDAYSKYPYYAGDKVVITKFENGKYYI